MAEYIEREALIEDLDAAAKHGGMGAIIAQTLRRYVKHVPATDVAPVVHGRWERYSTTMMVCSICGKHVAQHRYNYCPSCGAKMNGGAE